MNKKILILLVILTVCVSVIVGCSKVTGQEDSETSVSIMQSEGMDEPTPSDRDQNAVDEDASELIGKVDEIKDFMLIVRMMTMPVIHLLLKISRRVWRR